MDGGSQSSFFPKVTMVDCVFTEAVESRKQQTVLGAVSRMCPRAMADGFSVQRIHTDRGKKFYNSALRAFCQKFGLYQTFAIAQEHQICKKSLCQSTGLGLARGYLTLPCGAGASCRVLPPITPSTSMGRGPLSGPGCGFPSPKSVLKASSSALMPQEGLDPTIPAPGLLPGR